ncbi:MAG: 50S ribosomal protein L17 [SAR324 cluster bacterium]|nr:50S ribosomal protein L17 [SAR324 cluster bacterium]
MRHRKKGRALSRTASHKKATMRNMATSLFRHERIETTTAKAKELRPFAERLITLGKRGDLHARRLAGRLIADRQVLGKLFDDIGPRFSDRPGGYTRIIKTGFRHGDGAPMALIQLVGAENDPFRTEAAPTRRRGKGKAAEEGKEAKEEKSVLAEVAEKVSAAESEPEAEKS